MPQRPLTAAELLAMPDTPFKKIIEEELKPKRVSQLPEGTSRALRDPIVLDRLYHMLVRMLRNTEGQLAAWSADLNVVKADLLGAGRDDKAYIQARREYEKKRGSAIRFKSSVDVLLQEVKFLRSQERGRDGDTTWSVDKDRARLEARIAELEAAIRQHRDSFDSDAEPADTDLDLWALATPGDDEPDTDGKEPGDFSDHRGQTATPLP